MDSVLEVFTMETSDGEGRTERGNGDLMKLRMALLLMFFAATVPAFDVIDPAEIAPGSKGICITEMDGGEVVEIPLTVIGTVGPWTPEGEIVLVRLEDERFRHTGIIAGMSGSPVYVDGRLLGALAFGWSFSKEPIGGVTPFSRMESLARTSDQLSAAADDAQHLAGLATKPGEKSGLTDDGAFQAGAGPGRPSLVEMMEASLKNRLGDVLTDWLLPERTSQFTNLPVVVTSSGAWSPAGGDWLSEGWRRLGWVSVPGGSSHEASQGSLEPGAMVAGVLVDGDAVVAVGGTVTEVRDDEVWALGHPFLGGGEFRLPMARARVLTVLPSQASSFKFFSVGETIGSFISDRSRGIWGRLGEVAPMVPVTVTVNGRQFDFRSIRHPNLTPFTVGYLASSSQAARGRLFGVQTIAIRVELDYLGHEPVVYEEVLASGEAPAQAASIAAGLLAYLESSVFEAPELEAIAIDLKTEERLRGAELVDVIPERQLVSPGELVQVRLRLRPYRGEEFIRELAIRVPSGIPDGRLDLVVADGASWSLYDLGMRPLMPGSFDDELRLVDGLLPSTTMVMVFERRQPGVALSGGSVTMPAGMIVQLRAGLGPGLTTTSYAVVAKVEEAMDMPVSGAERIKLQVRSEGRLDRAEVP
jgi:hypothetical protein